jgi:16S rRNA processing protein RimM
VGRVVRPHGLRGEVVVELVSNRPERASAGAAFATDAGQLNVAGARPFGNRWLMVFEGIADLSSAERLRGTVLKAPALEDDDALWVHELVGATVVRHGDGTAVGRVRAVIANPASDLLELEDGSLVPVRFVVAAGKGQVEVDPPPGLLDP